MNRYYFEEAIVLKYQKIKDSDLLLTLYGKTKGKYNAIAPGALNIKNRLRGRVEPFCWGKGYFVVRRSLDLLINWETIDSYWEIRNNFEKLNLAFSIIKTIDKFVISEYSDEKIFNIIIEALNLVKEKYILYLKEIFFLKLLQSQGLINNFSIRCDKCGKVFNDEDILRVNIYENKVFCKNCSSIGLIVSLESIKSINNILNHSISELKNINIFQEICNLVKEYEKTLM
jgi:DNA repair protein RecO (recombination protein O)